MFSLDIVSSDAFLDMPVSVRELYFQLGMYADDDGFINPKKIIRMIGASEDDLRLLIAKRFVLPFETGVVVIKHWKINNYIQNDRYKPTRYLEEKELLKIKENGSYTESIQDVSKMETQVRLGKVSIGKVSILDEQKARPLSKKIEKNNEPSEKQLVYRRIIFHLQDALNTKITTWGKQCSAIKSILDAGYTEQQIIKTIDYMANKDDFYSDKGFDMTTVAKQIPLYKARTRKEATT